MRAKLLRALAVPVVVDDEQEFARFAPVLNPGRAAAKLLNEARDAERRARRKAKRKENGR